MKTKLLNSVGTLIAFTSLGDTVISPLPETNGGHGGAFWCLPNFDDGATSFTVRHGEYRKMPGEFLNETTVMKNISGPWGELESDAVWELGETELTSHMTLTAKRHETLIRPGFHPYLTLQKAGSNYHIIIGDKIIESSTILEDMKMVVPCTGEEGVIEATLTCGIRTAHIIFSVQRPHNTQPISFAFCLWTDKKENYICIEPVSGVGYDETGLPKPFKLDEEERLVLQAKLSFDFS